jgi:hypothetical protein
MPSRKPLQPKNIVMKIIDKRKGQAIMQIYEIYLIAHSFAAKRNTAAARGRKILRKRRYRSQV